MKKRAIPAIIVLFSLMLIGIIGIQAWWIKKSLKLNEQAFDAAVYRSLEGVVAQTEKKENFVILNKKWKGDSIIDDMSRNKIASIKAPKPKTIKTESFAFFSDDNGKSKKKSSASVKIEMDNNGEKLAFSSTDSGPFVTKDDREMNLKVKLLKLDTMMKKMVEFKSNDSLFVIIPSEVDSILTTQLKQNGLGNMKFTMALSHKNGSSYFYKSKDFNDTTSAYRVNLYPNDVFDRNTKLLATFPDKFRQVSSGIWWAFGLSILFTLAMLSLFIYSI